jgi:hypothetical protein
MVVCHEAETSFAVAVRILMLQLVLCFYGAALPEVFEEVSSLQIYVYGDWEYIKRVTDSRQWVVLQAGYWVGN